MKLKDLPNEEKPRERLIKYGVSNISNEDLISILIRTGSKNINVKELSNKILSKINSINSLNELSIRELTEIKGVGRTKALTILAAIELGKRVVSTSIEENVDLKNSKLIHDYFSSLIAKDNQENLLVILLDSKRKLISYQIMYKGTSKESVVSPREIFNYAVKERASAIVIMHNHPSGIVNPSKADIELTNKLIMSGSIIGIPLIDHLITNGKDYYSFYEEMSKEEKKIHEA